MLDAYYVSGREPRTILGLRIYDLNKRRYNSYTIFVILVKFDEVFNLELNYF